jgi:hypothetical protein
MLLVSTAACCGLGPELVNGVRGDAIDLRAVGLAAVLALACLTWHRLLVRPLVGWWRGASTEARSLSGAAIAGAVFLTSVLVLAEVAVVRASLGG